MKEWTEEDEAIWQEYQELQLPGYYDLASDDPALLRPCPNEPDHMSNIQMQAIMRDEIFDTIMDQLPPKLRWKVIHTLNSEATIVSNLWAEDWDSVEDATYDTEPVDPEGALDNELNSSDLERHPVRAVGWVGLALLLCAVALLACLTVVLLPLGLLLWLGSGWAFLRGLACLGFDVL